MPEPDSEPVHPDVLALYSLTAELNLIRDRVSMVASRAIASAYIYGPAGIGKTHLVGETLDALGQHGERRAGHMTAQALFEFLKRNRDAICYLDDVTPLFRNGRARPILLAALGYVGGHDKGRPVSYDMGKTQQQFVFTGGLIVTSNVLPTGDESVAALNSRLKPIAFTPSNQQIEAMMRYTVRDGWKDIPAEECLDVVEHVIRECRSHDVAPEMRLLYEHALPYYSEGKKGRLSSRWEDHLTSVVVGYVKLSHVGQKVMTRQERREHDQRIAAELVSKHGSVAAAAAEWYEKSVGNTGLRTLQRHAAKLRLAQ